MAPLCALQHGPTAALRHIPASERIASYMRVSEFFRNRLEHRCSICRDEFGYAIWRYIVRCDAGDMRNHRVALSLIPTIITLGSCVLRVNQCKGGRTMTPFHLYNVILSWNDWLNCIAIPVVFVCRWGISIVHHACKSSATLTHVVIQIAIHSAIFESQVLFGLPLPLPPNHHIMCKRARSPCGMAKPFKFIPRASATVNSMFQLSNLRRGISWPRALDIFI